MNKIFGLFFATLIAFSAPQIHAAEEGTINAIAHKELPGSREIHLRPLDNSDDAMILMEDFERELTARGYRLNPNAPLIMTFEVTDELGAFTSGDRRYFLELHARGSRTGGEDAQARFNVFDSNTGGILNRGRGKQTQIVTPTKYRLDVTIDRETGPSRSERLWQGWAEGELGTADSRQLTRAMVAPLVGNLGQTVRRKTFPLPR